ncbi:MAG TPA: hypothetical protein VMB34_19115 [Acetobacteraceae bacterium]|nr:hypothetical protein [Acetobacteraceae bacterium]
MTEDPIEAAERLASVLRRENAALAALDLRGAAEILAEKRAAADALLAALVGGAAPAPLHARLLRDLAGENRRRLEHAIAVQGRVIGLVARALRGSALPTQRYGATGALAGGRAGPVALSARA